MHLLYSWLVLIREDVVNRLELRLDGCSDHRPHTTDELLFYDVDKVKMRVAPHIDCDAFLIENEIQALHVDIKSHTFLARVCKQLDVGGERDILDVHMRSALVFGISAAVARDAIHVEITTGTVQVQSELRVAILVD